MAKPKIYKCCICHTVIENRNNRLVHQKYDTSKAYGLYKNKHNYDFCNKCFVKFASWIIKHKEV